MMFAVNLVSHQKRCRHGRRARPNTGCVARTLDVIGRMSKSKQPEGIKPREPEFDATRDEGPLYRPDKLIKSKKRVADHGEVFTPPWLVEKMLDLVKGETERIDSRFLEPACGSGNFLVPDPSAQAAGGRGALRQVRVREAPLCAARADLLSTGSSCWPTTSPNAAPTCSRCSPQYLSLTEDDELYHAASHVLSLNLDSWRRDEDDRRDGGPIMIVEWGYIGKGKFQRRDFSLKNLTQAGALKEEAAGYAGHLRCLPRSASIRCSSRSPAIRR